MYKKLLFYALILAAFCIACNSVNRVLKDPEKLNKVGQEWEKTHPCVTDTIVSHSPTDTLIQLDSIYVAGDTIRRHDSVFITGASKTYLKTITTTIRTTLTITDLRRLGLARDSVEYWRGQTAFQKGQYDAQVTKTKAAESSKNKAWLYFWLCVVINAGVHLWPLIKKLIAKIP